MAFNFADLLTTIAAGVPEAEVAAIGGRRCTYAELEERSCRLANVLYERGDLCLHWALVRFQLHSRPVICPKYRSEV